MTVEPPTRILRVDLDTSTVDSEPVPQHWLERYLGGKGLGARYLYEAVPADVDPLGDENALLFLFGPLSGLLPGEVRYTAVTTSPLTGTFLDSYCGGEFAASLVGALGEHVGLIVTGDAAEPTVLAVADGTAELTARPDLWGGDVVETDAAFPDADVACIGPAGENHVRYATIAADGGAHHAGRGGAGAVMGAKRLKAVVARGERPTALPELRAAYAERLREHADGRWLAAGGTIESADFANEVGVLPTRGWQRGTFDGTDGIGIEAVQDAVEGRERTPMRAEQATEPRDDSAEDGPGGFRIRPDSGEHVPRGATQMALGAGLGIDDFDAVATLGETCDRLGLDVISAGNAVAWAVRATEAGFLDRALSFGDGDAARALIEAIAERDDDLASTLADGVAAAGDRFGGADLVPTIKAAELPPYDPRGALGMALAYATSDRGACHRRARPVEREAFESESWTDADRVDAVRTSQLERSVLWSLGADDFATAVLRADLGAEWLAAVGLDYTRGELQAIGERIWTLTRLFNVRAGFDRTDDTLPDALQEPHADAGRADHDADAGMDGIDPGRFERLRSRYYAACGWSERGLPANPLLERLGLQDVVDADTPVADAPLTFDDADDSS